MATKHQTPEEIENERQYQLAEKERKEAEEDEKKAAEAAKPKGRIEAGASEPGKKPPSEAQNAEVAEAAKPADTAKSKHKGEY